MSRDLEPTLRRLRELVARLEPLTQSPVTAAPLLHTVARDRLRRIHIWHHTIWRKRVFTATTDLRSEEKLQRTLECRY